MVGEVECVPDYSRASKGSFCVQQGHLLLFAAHAETEQGELVHAAEEQFVEVAAGAELFHRGGDAQISGLRAESIERSLKQCGGR